MAQVHLYNQELEFTLISLLHSNISIHIHYTILFIIPMVPTGEFVWQSGASYIGDHFLYSHDLEFWFKSNTVKGNLKPDTLRG